MEKAPLPLADGYPPYLFADRRLSLFSPGAFFFHPRSLPADHRFSFSQPFEEMNIPFGKTNLNLFRFKAGGQRKGIVLFFHGNRENVEHYKQYPCPLYRAWL